MALILDTGPLLAALDSADADHNSCAALLIEANEELIVPALVLAELDYWCAKRLNPAVWTTFLEDVLAGAYRIEPPTLVDIARCHELQSTYHDLQLGIVDASVLALAERLCEHKLATLDHRHFNTVRPAHTDALRLLPD